MIPWLDPADAFPPVEAAETDPNGLLAAGADLSPERVVDAYRRGIFPWFGPREPVLWWSPDPRMVLVPANLRVSRSLLKRLRRRDYIVTADTAFRDVMAACAAPRDEEGGTWITRPMARAYGALHEAGVAHSVETWIGDELAGGLYGVAIGRMFFGESMFTRVTDASKIAFVHAVRQLERWGVPLIDCQMSTGHLASLGAREISRAAFLAEVARLVDEAPLPARWVLDDTDTLVGASWSRA